MLSLYFQQNALKLGLEGTFHPQVKNLGNIIHINKPENLIKIF